MVTAWVIRSGRYGERDSWALNHGCSGGGWAEVPDLINATTRDQVAQIVTETYAGSDALIANYTGQLWALRGRVQPGDLLVMPMKTTKLIAMGRVTGGYEYRAKEEPLWAGAGLKPPALQARDEVEAVDEPELATDIEEVAYDRITARISEDFAGHNLATLVTAILETDGLTCTRSPPGPDGGIDIVAGRGVLGLDSPILVQVKSGAQVGAPVVNQLHGVMATHGADQGLLVAWGGLTKQAQDALKNHKLRVRVWDAADVVDAVLSNYERLPAEIRATLPLKRVWMLQDT